jgi:hypothetical protein
VTDPSLCIGSRLRNRLAVLSQVLCLEPAERPLQPFRRFPGYDPEIPAHGTEILRRGVQHSMSRRADAVFRSVVVP